MGHSIAPVRLEVVDAIHDRPLAWNATAVRAQVFIAIPSSVGLERGLGAAAMAIPGILEYDHDGVGKRWGAPQRNCRTGWDVGWSWKGRQSERIRTPKIGLVLHRGGMKG